MKKMMVLLVMAVGTLAACAPQVQSVEKRLTVANFTEMGGETRMIVCQPKAGLTDQTMVARCGEPVQKFKTTAYNGADRKDECWVYDNIALPFGATQTSKYFVACFRNEKVVGMTREDTDTYKFQLVDIFGLNELPGTATPPPAPAAPPPPPPAAPAPAPEG